MENLFHGLIGLVLIVGTIAGIARHDFRKRRNEYTDTVEKKNKYKRTTRRIDLTLAASVILMFTLFYFEPDAPVSPVSQDPVVADTADETLPEGVYGPGTYKVGSDIPAGEYKLTADEGNYRGYYEVKDDVSSDGGILSNSLFDGTEYVEVRTGEYLSVTRATFTLVVQAADVEAEEEDVEPVVAEEPVEPVDPYFFTDVQQEAEFFKAISLTLEQGVTTMQDASAMSRMCGKVCPDVPGDDWALQLEAMNEEMFALQRNLYDLGRDLQAVPVGGSPNIDFEARDTLVQDMKTLETTITVLITKTDWATWQDGWDAMDEANRLIEKMYATDVYTVPR